MSEKTDVEIVEEGGESNEKSREAVEKQIAEVAVNLREAAAQGVGLSLQAQVNLSSEDVKLIVEPEHKLLPYFACRVVADGWRDHINQFLDAAATEVQRQEMQPLEILPNNDE